MNGIFSTSYWTVCPLFKAMRTYDTVILDDTESYERQSWRNRTRILTANGPLDLSIPVLKGKGPVSEIRISYSENWQKDHWGAIRSAYGKAPFFEYFEKDVEQFYTKRLDLLLEYNMTQLSWLLKVLRLKNCVCLLSNNELTNISSFDHRKDFHPKKDIDDKWKVLPYGQTFSDRFDFNAELSILDLIFNKGLSGLENL